MVKREVCLMTHAIWLLSLPRLLYALLLLFSSVAVQADIQVSMDRTQIGINESFNVVFSSDEDIGNADLKPLQRDFEIINSRTSTNMRIVNGQFSKESKLALTLMPKREGTLTIPALQFSQGKSAALQILVKQEENPGNDDEDVIVEMSVSNNSPYIQSEVLLTLKVLVGVGGVNQASFTTPELESGEWLLERFGNDKSYRRKIGGRTYSIVERQYLVYPQSSGRIKIRPVSFQMYFLPSSGQGFFADPFNTWNTQPRKISKLSNELILQVRPIPATFSGKYWLPARKLQLQEQWSEDPSTWIQGQPVTRTLLLRAEGLAATQLPELEMTAIESFKSYPDKIELQEREDTGTAEVRRIQRVAVIPNQAGNFVLPALRLPWWNTETDREEVIELPQRPIVVQASEIEIPVSSFPDTVVEQSVAGDTSDSTQPSTTATQAMLDTAGSGWFLAFVCSLMLWLGSILFWYLRVLSQKRSLLLQRSEKKESVNRVRSDLHRSCRRQDASACRQHLLTLIALHWPEQRLLSLADVAEWLHDIGKKSEGEQEKGMVEVKEVAEFSLAVQRLSEYLYGQGEVWQGEAFWDTFKSWWQWQEKYHSKKQQGTPATGLQPLYR